MIRQDVSLGLVCRQARRSGFKLAIVVGYPASDASWKLRVCFWRAASRCWTKPTLVEPDTLQMLDQADHDKRGALIKRASQAALDLKLVGRVWS